MPVHVSISIPTEHFAFRRFADDARVEFERCVPFDGDPAPYLWVTGDNEGVPAGECADAQGVQQIARAGGERLVRAEYQAGRSEVFDALRASEATCLSGFKERESWNLTLRFPSASGVSDWYRTCPESASRVTIRRVRAGEPSRADGAASLTDSQRKTLRTALETGYFSVPRQISLEELAERHGVSDTAASQRLRRGIERLLVERFGELRT